MKTIHEEREIPVTYECDVLIAGGGTAGVVAAIASARTGAKTMLVEKENFLGGSLLNGAGPIHSFFNLYQAFPDAKKVQVIRGIPQDIIDRMIRDGGSYGHLEQEVGGDHDSTATLIDRELYKNTANQMVLEEGVHLLLNTWLAGAVCQNGTISHVIIENKSGRQAIAAKVFIDCTGDADLTAYAGGPFKNLSKQHAVSLPYALANVDLSRVEAFARETKTLFTVVHHDKGSETDDVVRIGFDMAKVPGMAVKMYGTNQSSEANDTSEKKEEKAFDFSKVPKYSTFLFGPWGVNYHEKEWGYVNSNLMMGIDSLNAEDLTRAEVDLRACCVRMTKLLQENIPGFEHCYISWTPSFLGVRVSRIVDCEYILSEEDIAEGHRFDDEVALYGYHDYAPRIQIRNGGFYGFPYRSFIPKGMNNLLVAGRLITKDHNAHMSSRNTGGCMVQGHAVGTAAALAAAEDGNVRHVDVEKLKETLRLQGAFLG